MQFLPFRIYMLEYKILQSDTLRHLEELVTEILKQNAQTNSNQGVGQIWNLQGGVCVVSSDPYRGNSTWRYAQAMVRIQ